MQLSFNLTTINLTEFLFDLPKINQVSISTTGRFWTHLVMQYVFTFWTCYVLYKEYNKVATMRLDFLASEKRRPDQFTVFPLPLFQHILIRIIKFNLYLLTSVAIIFILFMLFSGAGTKHSS